MKTGNQASLSYSQDTAATADAIWACFTDVSSWNDWNAGVQSCTLDGAFANGSRLTMVLPDHEVITSQLIDVVDLQRFTDETIFGEAVVRVAHVITPRPGAGNRITFEIDVASDDAAAICAGVSSDFPAVIAALVERAERRLA